MRATRATRGLALAAAAVACATGVLAATGEASAQCARLTAPIAARLSAALRPGAPAWARPLIAPAMLVRYEASNFRQLTFLLGYSMLSIERLGTNGAPPYTATVVVRCRGLVAETIADPLAWATQRARELHVTLATAEQAAGFTAEVVALGTGRRPEGAAAARHGGIFRVTVNLAPRQGDNPNAPVQVVYEVTRDGTIQRVGG